LKRDAHARVRAVVGRDIFAVAAIERVGAGAAVEVVVIVLAVELVVALIAPQVVVVVPAEEVVIALAALEPVVAGAAEKPVSAIVAEEVVAAAKAANRVVPVTSIDVTPAATASAAVRWLRERLRRFPYCVSRARDRYSADLCGPCSPDRRPDVETHSHAHQACRPACSATEQIRAGDNLRTAKAIGLELPRTLLTR
jgi:hypothetical protein